MVYTKDGSRELVVMPSRDLDGSKLPERVSFASTSEQFPKPVALSDLLGVVMIDSSGSLRVMCKETIEPGYVVYALRSL